MASEQQVRQYLAYWFQLGKRVLLCNGEESLLPQPVIQGDRYSPSFEACWQRVTLSESGDCYLEGTNQTVRELLTPAWDVDVCGRCSMLIPLRKLGVMSLECPCIDLPTWPNLELPLPRAPINSQRSLERIRDRLHHSEESQRD